MKRLAAGSHAYSLSALLRGPTQKEEQEMREAKRIVNNKGNGRLKLKKNK